MKFNVTIQEIYEKKVTGEADSWHDALMNTIKSNDRGELITTNDDLRECNVDIEGWPNQKKDKFCAILMGDTRKKAAWFLCPLT